MKIETTLHENLGSMMRHLDNVTLGLNASYRGLFSLVSSNIALQSREMIPYKDGTPHSLIVDELAKGLTGLIVSPLPPNKPHLGTSFSMLRNRSSLLNIVAHPLVYHLQLFH